MKKIVSLLVLCAGIAFGSGDWGTDLTVGESYYWNTENRSDLNWLRAYTGYGTMGQQFEGSGYTPSPGEEIFLFNEQMGGPMRQNLFYDENARADGSQQSGIGKVQDTINEHVGAIAGYLGAVAMAAVIIFIIHFALRKTRKTVVAASGGAGRRRFTPRTV